MDRAKKASDEVKQFSTGSDILQALKDFSSTGVLDDVVIHDHGQPAGIIGDGHNVGLYTQDWGSANGAPNSQTTTTFAMAVRDGQILLSTDATITIFGCNCSNLAQELSAKLSVVAGRKDISITGANNFVYEKNGGAAVDKRTTGISAGSRGTFITYRDGVQIGTRLTIRY